MSAPVRRGAASRARAQAIARAGRALREALARQGPPLREVLRALGGRAEDEEDEELADASAQVVLAELLGAHLDPAGAAGAARAALRGWPGLAGPLAELERAIAAVERGWSFEFYEEILAALDPRARDQAGAYYTPLEVVRMQVALTREVLERELGRPLGFADPGVLTIDPAGGAGIYPSAIIEDAAGRGGAAGLALAALEVMPGACALARIRVAGALRGAGVEPPAGVTVVQGDTLATPLEEGPLGPRLRRAEVRVCIGNPPYGRQARAGAGRRGGWVRFGRAGEAAPLADFSPGPGAGRHAKNLYNDYVYFWRWALRTAVEGAGRGGVVCFITASSFLGGPGFAAMRRHMRAVLDALWIVDLGGDALGPRRSANVCGVKTPLCVGLALRRPGPRREGPAAVWYCRLPDALDRAAKLGLLGRVRARGDLRWTRAAEAWEAPFVPEADAGPSRWPRLDALFPWTHSGAQWKRTWPIGETRELLERRWRALLQAEDRAAAFRESEAWTLARAGADPLAEGEALPPLASLAADAPVPPVMRYGWRALDRQWCLADGRLGDRLRPALWRVRGPRQIFLTTLMSTGLSRGPALVACAEVPDLHHFRGSFGDRGVIPLWRDAAATRPNLAEGLLAALAGRHGRALEAEELFAYVYGCLAHPAYTALLSEQGVAPGPRVPLSADLRRFARMAALGRELLWLHTYGERMAPRAGGKLAGAARCARAVPEDAYPERFEWAAEVLRVGDGRFAPVSAEVWGYEVSGLKVVASWLGFRMRAPRGRRSSPLDALRPARWTEEMTRELLELLWVIEGSLALHREQAPLLAEIVAGPLVELAGRG